MGRLSNTAMSDNPVKWGDQGVRKIYDVSSKGSTPTHAMPAVAVQSRQMGIPIRGESSRGDEQEKRERTERNERRNDY